MVLADGRHPSKPSIHQYLPLLQPRTSGSHRIRRHGFKIHLLPLCSVTASRAWTLHQKEPSCFRPEPSRPQPAQIFARYWCYDDVAWRLPRFCRFSTGSCTTHRPLSPMSLFPSSNPLTIPPTTEISCQERSGRQPESHHAFSCPFPRGIEGFHKRCNCHEAAR